MAVMVANPPVALRAQAELELRKRRRARESMTFREFIQRVNHRYQFYDHAERLIDVLQRVADGEIKRLMVFMPPRHSKSETVSRLFAAYYLYRHPNRWVGLASYAADLAYSLSRNARENYRISGGYLNKQAQGVEQWQTGSGGGMWAAGVGGPATGKGFHLGIVDDPLKNAEEAASPTIRNKQKDWYLSTFYTRQEPGAAVVVIQTRWHEDDLSGWLLQQESEEPEHWHIVNMEAIKSETKPAFPPTCTVMEDPRQPGEALCPERYSLEKLQSVMRRLGTYFWEALFQQRPRPLDGGLFKRNHFQMVDAPPSRAWRVRYWDKAASTSTSAKFTAGVLVSIDEQYRVYVEHVVRGQWSTLERREIMRSTAQMDGHDVLIAIEQEPGSSGLDSVQDEIRMLAGYAVYADRPTGDKTTRMLPLAAQAEAGNLHLVRGAWNAQFIDELCAVPNGTYRDQADAAAGGFNRLVDVIETPANETVIHDEAVSISPY